jgi:hypothetical protein
MADQPYGVYVSLRTQEGALISVMRAEPAEVASDLDVLFGEGFSADLFKRVAAAYGNQQVAVLASPSPSPTPPAATPAAASDEEALEMVKEALGASEVTEAAAPAQQFEPCKICGTPKTQWVPPGVSKTGRKYAGFYGCPNIKNHPRR